MNLIVLTALLGYSIFDYIVYNAVKDLRTQDPPVWYRILQAVVLTRICWWLSLLNSEWGFDWRPPTAFMLVWWTFGCDWAYYGIAWLLNPTSGRYDGRDDIARDFDNGITHAWWTLLGLIALLFGAKKTDPAPVKLLIAQSVVGFIAALVILNL